MALSKQGGKQHSGTKNSETINLQLHPRIWQVRLQVIHGGRRQENMFLFRLKFHGGFPLNAVIPVPVKQMPNAKRGFSSHGQRVAIVSMRVESVSGTMCHKCRTIPLSFTACARVTISHNPIKRERLKSTGWTENLHWLLAAIELIGHAWGRGSSFVSIQIAAVVTLGIITLQALAS